MVAPLAGLAIGLATVFQRPQQLSHQPLADVEPLGNQHLDQMSLAAADPAQRRTWITTDRILDQCLERRRQTWLMHNRRLAPAPRTAGRRTDHVATGAQLGDPSVDGTAGNPSGPCHCAHTPIALGQCLVRCEQTPSPFAEEVLKQQIPGSDVLDVDHPLRVFPWRRVAPSKFAIFSLRFSGQLDSIISPRILIAVYSPQARGRSERAFSTLQDRLPKELKLAGISTVETTNVWLRRLHGGAQQAVRDRGRTGGFSVRG